MNRGDVKLIIDRCIAHDVPDAADLIERQAAQIEMMRQQLSAALAACKQKDEALVLAGAANAWQNFGECRAFTKERIPSPREVDDTIKSALAIQPDDSALKAYIGEPVLWRSKRGLITSDQILPDDEPLYSPKGLK